MSTLLIYPFAIVVLLAVYGLMLRWVRHP